MSRRVAWRCNLKPQQRDLTPVLRRSVEPAALFGHAAMSDLSSLCAQKRTCRQPVVIKTDHHEIALFVSSFLYKGTLRRAHQMGP